MKTSIDVTLTVAALAAVVIAGVAFKANRDSAALNRAAAYAVMPTFDLQGQSLPALNTLASGKIVSYRLAETARPALVVFFRSTCPACEATAPAWKTLRAAMPSTMRFVVVSSEGEVTATTWMNRHEIVATEVLYPAQASEMVKWGVKAVPTTLVTDAHGTVIYSHVGALQEVDVKEVARVLQSLPAGE